ncbi:DJ-1/PfpI family protein [Streptomyces sp. NPDC017964]|uniref:DJ-1/PfpI family protein n=1 Tax=Streptomyces sp. NPDC017964 TaxID=3365022 RepID=UPI0037B4D6F3
MAEATRQAKERADPGAGPDALRVGVLAYPDCFASEVFGVPDLMTMAGHVAGPDAPGYRVSVISPRRRVTASGGAWLDVRPVREVDVLVVPGFELRPDTDLDARLARLAPEISAIRAQAAAGTAVVSLCVGAFLLAEAGLLDRRRATTSWLQPANWPGAAPTPTCSPSTWSSQTRG